MQHAPVVVPLAVALASLLVAPFLWWRWISRPSAFDVCRGAHVGVMISVLSPPLTWWLVRVLSALSSADHVATDWGWRPSIVGFARSSFGLSAGAGMAHSTAWSDDRCAVRAS